MYSDGNGLDMGFEKIEYDEVHGTTTGRARLSRGATGRKRQSVGGAGAFSTSGYPGDGDVGSPSKSRRSYFPKTITKKQKIRLGIIVAVAAVLVIVAVVVGIFETW